VSGGFFNTTSGAYASASSGFNNEARGDFESIVAGEGLLCDDGDATPDESQVCGEGTIDPPD
jgi:hypothetical protein